VQERREAALARRRGDRVVVGESRRLTLSRACLGREYVEGLLFGAWHVVNRVTGLREGHDDLLPVHPYRPVAGSLRGLRLNHAVDHPGLGGGRRHQGEDRRGQGEDQDRCVVAATSRIVQRMVIPPSGEPSLHPALTPLAGSKHSLMPQVDHRCGRTDDVGRDLLPPSGDQRKDRCGQCRGGGALPHRRHPENYPQNQSGRRRCPSARRCGDTPRANARMVPGSGS
jgi:hypothetical protein